MKTHEAEATPTNSEDAAAGEQASAPTLRDLNGTVNDLFLLLAAELNVPLPPFGSRTADAAVETSVNNG